MQARNLCVQSGVSKDALQECAFDVSIALSTGFQDEAKGLIQSGVDYPLQRKKIERDANVPPVFSAQLRNRVIRIFQNRSSETIQLRYVAKDPEGGAVTLRLGAPLPDGASFNAATGDFSFKLPKKTAQYQIVIEATDICKDVFHFLD